MLCMACASAAFTYPGTACNIAPPAAHRIYRDGLRAVPPFPITLTGVPPSSNRRSKHAVPAKQRYLFHPPSAPVCKL